MREGACQLSLSGDNFLWLFFQRENEQVVYKFDPNH